MAKRAADNCFLHKKAKKEGIGQCETYNGKCVGYAGADGDEPCDTCKECNINTAYEEECDDAVCSECKYI